MSPPVLKEVLVSLATAALHAAEADAKQTGHLIFRDEWKPTPRTRGSTTKSWFIPMLEHLNWSELLRSMQDPFTNVPEPEPAAPSPSTASGSAPPPSATTEPSSQASPERPSQPQPQEDHVDRLLKVNKEVYDKLIYHDFPRALGDGSASLDGFRYYMIQDTYYLQTCARVKMATAYQAPNFEDIENFNFRNSSSLEYVTKSEETLISMLGVPKKSIYGTRRNKTIDASQDHYLTSVQNLKEDAYLGYYVVLLPCVLSYWKIAKRLAEDENTAKSVVYHPAWTEVNNDSSSALKYMKFINENINENIKLKGGVERWNGIFKRACELEIKVFDTGLLPMPDRPLYQIVPNGIYFVQSSPAAEKVVLANQNVENSIRSTRLGPYFPSDLGSSVVGVKKTGGDNEKWHVVATETGYTFQNVGTGHYLGIATEIKEGRILRTVVEPYYWWINPVSVKSQPSDGPLLFQIFETANLRYRLQAETKVLSSVNQVGSTNVITPIISYRQDSELEGPCEMWSLELDQNMSEFIAKYEKILREKFKEIEQSREKCTKETGQKLLMEAKGITVTGKEVTKEMTELFDKYEQVLGDQFEAIEKQRRDHTKKKGQDLLDEARRVTDSKGIDQMAALFAKYEGMIQEELGAIEKYRKEQTKDAKSDLFKKAKDSVAKNMEEFKLVGKYQDLLRENVAASDHFRKESDKGVREELLAEARL